MFLYNKLKKYFLRYRGKDNLEIDYETAMRIINNDKMALLIDARSRQEYNEGHMKGSINIPIYDLERGKYNIKEKDRTIILYCSYGKRSRKAAQILKRAGYENVYCVEGGIPYL